MGTPKLMAKIGGSLHLLRMRDSMNESACYSDYVTLGRLLYGP